MKVLPEALTGNAEALARFESEAQAVAALSHSNILALFDVGEEGGVRYAVSELLEGETLRLAMAHGPIPPRRALDIAREVADGLAAAHEKGIVHRDVKPENVFLTKDGRAKVLDFGLARHDVSRRDPGDTRSPTLAAISEKGVVLGTVAYMSPEQARGTTADFRSDQFSLGIVLYEMLSGSKPFEAAPRRDDDGHHPRRAGAAREEGPDVPAPVRWLVERLLAKEPAERYDATRDLARDLKGLRDRLSTWTQASPAGLPARKTALRWIPLAAGAALLVVLGAMAGRRTAPPPLAPPRLAYITSSGRDADPAISPDGRLCAFASSRDGVSRIWLKQLADGSEVALTAGPDLAPRFTPDSAGIFFIRQESSAPALYRVPTLGGPPQRVLADAAEADVSPDGTRLAFVRPRTSESGPAPELWVAGTDGSGARLVDTAETVQVRSPRWSPDGKWVATTRGQINIGAPWKVVLVNPATAEKRTLPSPGGIGEVSDVAWTRGVRALVYGRRDQAIVPSSPGAYYLQEVASGALKPIAYSLGVGQGLDIAASGRLIVTSFVAPTNLLEVPLAGRDRARRWLSQGSQVNFQPLLAGDGETLVFTSNRDGNSDIWELNRRSSAVRRLTSHPASDADSS